MKDAQIGINAKILELLKDITENEYQDIFAQCKTNDDKLQLLTSESMLALVFISSIEDEFSIEFEDDEIDMFFFTTIENLEKKIKKYINLSQS